MLAFRFPCLQSRDGVAAGGAEMDSRQWDLWSAMISPVHLVFVESPMTQKLHNNGVESIMCNRVRTGFSARHSWQFGPIVPGWVALWGQPAFSRIVRCALSSSMPSSRL